MQKVSWWNIYLLSHVYGYFAILTPLKLIKNGHFRRLKLISFLYY